MSKKAEIPQVELKVAKAVPEDAEKGIVRLDAKSMQGIKVSPGDIVELEGERKSVAVAAKAYPSDVGLGVIRMDGLMRRNSRAGIGEVVKLARAEVKEAVKVTLAPAEQGIQLQIMGPGLEKSLMGRPVVKGDIISPLRARIKRQDSDPFQEVFSSLFEEGMSPFMGFAGLKLMVVNTKPSGPVVITDMTKVEISPQAVELKEDERIPQITYEDIGGHSEEIAKVREMIELPMKHPEIFDKLGVQPPKGVLLYGPPGTGKTLLAKAVANETNANFFSINGPEMMSKWYGESEKNLRELFDNAEKDAPSIIFIDEIDAIAPKRGEVQGEVERRVVATLLAAMDGLKSRGRVVIIAATNRQDSLDEALRRGGRFDREIEIGVPDRKGRKEIFQIHTRAMPLESKVNLDKLADITYGYVGADIEAVCKEAAMSALRRILPKLNLDEDKEISPDMLEDLRITSDDFQTGLRNVSPSAMREVLVEIPRVTWKDIGGLETVKQELKEAVEWPLSNPSAFKKMGIKPPKGILLYGPPGTGKTLLAKAVANESNANFIAIKGPELLSKWVGESEQGVRKIFKKARQVAPSILFFDEIDSLAPARGRSTGSNVSDTVVNQILTEIDGMEGLENVVVIAATNRPDIVDPGLLRPGRFDRHILTPLPDEESRKKIFKIHTKDMPLSKDVKIAKLAEMTEGYVGADIEALCREAAMLALRKTMKAKEVNSGNFEEAIKAIRPTMSDELQQSYEKILQTFKKNIASDVKSDLKYLG
ncbi:MAG: CDC48 family AAA ATPase [archaeon]|jgi:transitional endoplasmic reticulum ATPase|nr:CDC48 family AAA ATPase [archaeon]|tara:strand:- start:7059 stop:9347 length:2289 start_codon:yes stop_codon:yes gene_type:complete